MNLTPEWVPALRKHGWGAAHWPDDGDPRASGKEIMDQAVTHHFVVFTNDMDFGIMLAHSHEAGPAGNQIRTVDPIDEHPEGSVLAALNQHESDLSAGALVVVDEIRSRVRVLPI